MKATVESRLSYLEEKIKELDQVQKPKPIIMISIPNIYSRETIQVNLAHLKNELQGYHVLMFSSTDENIQFNVFYEKNFKPIDMDGIEKIIKNGFKEE